MRTSPAWCGVTETTTRDAPMPDSRTRGPCAAVTAVQPASVVQSLMVTSAAAESTSMRGRSSTSRIASWSAATTRASTSRVSPAVARACTVPA
jgi:hypothetical protein